MESSPSPPDAEDPFKSVQPTPTEETPSSKRTSKKKNIGLCSQELLKLVARGSAIICEILRLKDYIPEPYINPSEEKLYKDIIFDFTIFDRGNIDKFEAQMATDQDLLDKDEDFRENYIELIERFFSLFDSIYQYITDWKTFIDQINTGKFVQHTVDTILSHKDMRPLFCESVFSAGVMLLLIDRLIPGTIREKLIVSYYRYKGQSTIPHFQEIYKLFAKTNYKPPTNFSNPKDEVRPPKYPVDYFNRCQLNKKIIEKIIGTILGNDIYDQQLAYPTTNEYQTVAFSQQASLLVVNLFFCPEILERDQRNMTAIVNKHFHDNFVVSFYMGYTIDINEYWKEFKEAYNALEFNMKTSILKDNKNKKLDQIKILDKKIKDYLNEGVMTEEYVLKNIENLLTIMRDSNVILRWFILQRNITNKKIREIFNDKLKNEDLILLLLDLSQFEDLLKTMFQKLVFNKTEMWENDRNFCIQKLSELISYYSGNSAFSNTVKYENYSKYFEETSKKISELKSDNPNRAGVRIGKIKDRLLGIRSLDKISESANAKENIRLINEKLDHMLMLANVKRSYLISISKISDFSYAWISIHDYCSEMQRVLQVNSKNVLLLRATFLKLASILNFPLVRLFEIESEDIESVTNYYSGELVVFVKSILQIIPISVFQLLDDVSKIFSSGFKEIPIKILKNNIKDFAQNEMRYKLAKDAHLISVFTKGIFMMEKTLMGVIEVDPKVILEEGIRKELLKLLAKTFHSYIDFSYKDKVNLTDRLNELINKINSIKKSFLYIQDYININGSKMWGEEMHRLINHYVKLEANKFLARKIKQKASEKPDSENYLKFVVPCYQPLKNTPESATFLGRLTRYVINLTDPKNSNFCPANFSWYDKNNNEIFGIKVLNKIKLSIGEEGFQGFGKLLGFLIYHNLLTLKNTYQKIITDPFCSKALRVIQNAYGSPFVARYSDKNGMKTIMDYMQTLYKNLNGFNLAQKLNDIGQLCFLKKLQTYLLNENTEVEANMLNTEVKSLNGINLLILKNNININFVKDAANNPDEPENKVNNAKDSLNSLDNYYFNLCSFFEDFGYVDSQHTFYSNLTSMQNMPLVLGIVTFNEMKNFFVYDKKSKVMKKTRNENLDLFYFTNGIYNILYQMGKSNIIIFIALLSDILRGELMNKYTLKDYRSISESYLEVPKNITYLQLFLQEMAYNAGIDIDFFEIGVNGYLLFSNA